MTQLIDADIRQRALDTRHSFAVSAPAGSGKTGLLTQRVLALLSQCEQPENVLAITFTKKAAAEMQHRILAALHHAIEHPEEPADAFAKATWQLARKVISRDQEKQWQLLTLPNRLQITTIDSLCRKLSQHMPLDNMLGYTSDVLDSAETQKAYELAARETLKLLEKTSPLQTDLKKLVQHFNNQLNNVESLLILLLSRRDQWLGPLIGSRDQQEQLESTLQEIIAEHLQASKQKLLGFTGELCTLADYAATELTKENSNSPICECAGLVELPPSHHSAIIQWLGLAELILTKQGQTRNTVDKRCGFPAANKEMNKEEKEYAKSQKNRMLALLEEVKEIPELAEQLHQIRSLPSPNYTNDQWQLLDSLTRVLTLLVAQLKLVFQTLGKTDFIEITLSALNALDNNGEPTDLALMLDYRIQHILVDEFQDTSTPQLNLLRQLTAGWQSDDGRTLFIVGDAMQSCYGFRDANVGIFLDIREHGLGDIALESLDLSVNFRSQEKLVNWCNTTFAELFPAKNKINLGAVCYQQAIAYKQPETDNNAVSAYLFCSKEKPKDRTDETQKIIEIINDVKAQSSEDSIAVLVRKRSQVSEITQALSKEKIPYQATDIDRLDTDMLIMDFLSLTRALLYPNDRIAWLSLLRGPWCGLDMFDLHKLANTSSEKTISLLSLLVNDTENINLSSAGEKILSRFKNAITIIFQQQGRHPLRQWIESAWLQLGGNALLIEPEEQQITKQYFNLLEKYQSGTRIEDWKTFTDAIGRLYANNVSNIQNSNVKPVEIMTIHKSKGLEFDTVIIPGIEQTSASDKQQLLSWLEWLDKKQRSKLVISPVSATGKDSDPIHKYIREQQKLKQKLESDRLFYVGCTRAIKQLHLLAYIKSDLDKESITENGSDSLDLSSEKNILSKVWPQIKDKTEVFIVDTDDDNKNNMGTLRKHPNILIRQQADWQQPQYPQSSLLENYRLNHYSEKLAINNKAAPTELQQRHARYLGTVLHQTLQHITESGYANWDDKRIFNQRSLWQKQLEQLGSSATIAKQQTDKIESAITQMLADKTGQWLLDNQHVDSACELSLWTNEKNTVKELIIDRTFIDSSTMARWIIDYKSSTPIQDETLDDFIIREAKHYQQQLVRYSSLFPHEKEIRLALYFPLVNIFYQINR